MRSASGRFEFPEKTLKSWLTGMPWQVHQRCSAFNCVAKPAEEAQFTARGALTRKGRSVCCAALDRTFFKELCHRTRTRSEDG